MRRMSSWSLLVDVRFGRFSLADHVSWGRDMSCLSGGAVRRGFASGLYSTCCELTLGLIFIRVRSIKPFAR